MVKSVGVVRGVRADRAVRTVRVVMVTRVVGTVMVYRTGCQRVEGSRGGPSVWSRSVVYCSGFQNFKVAVTERPRVDVSIELPVQLRTCKTSRLMHKGRRKKISQECETAQKKLKKS